MVASPRLLSPRVFLQRLEAGGAHLLDRAGLPARASIGASIVCRAVLAATSPLPDVGVVRSHFTPTGLVDARPRHGAPRVRNEGRAAGLAHDARRVVRVDLDAHVA